MPECVSFDLQSDKKYYVALSVQGIESAHITVTFCGQIASAQHEEIENACKLISDYLPAKFTLGDVAWFGRNKDIKVRRGEFDPLQTTLCTLLTQLHQIYGKEEYDDYGAVRVKPNYHITYQPSFGFLIDQLDEVVCDRIYFGQVGQSRTQQVTQYFMQ
jgi:hypothetical protein